MDADSSRYLWEIPEEEATGSTAQIYAEIRGTLGAPVVSLIYRALATTPGLLERVWAEVEPNLNSGYVREAGTRLEVPVLPGVTPIPASAIAAAGFDIRTTLQTLADYHAVNAANMIVLLALKHGSSRGGASRQAERAIPVAVSARAVQAVRGTPSTALDLLEDMSATVSDVQGPVIVPSLLRQLATPPSALAVLWTAVRQSLTGREVPAAAKRITEQALTAAQSLPYAVARLDLDAPTQLIDRFLETIPRVLLMGTAMQAALVEAL